jgi:polyhydroxybutyrate depolymerase
VGRLRLAAGLVLAALSAAPAVAADRPIGGDWRQGDTVRAIGLLKRHNACPAAPDRRTRAARLACAHWTTCARGGLRVCLHDGGHMLKPGWIAAAVRWMQRRGR